MSEKLTKAQWKALEWFKGKAPTCWFEAGDPTPITRYRLFEAGKLARYVDGGMVFWTITPAGRAALSEART